MMSLEAGSSGELKNPLHPLVEECAPEIRVSLGTSRPSLVLGFYDLHAYATKLRLQGVNEIGQRMRLMPWLHSVNDELKLLNFFLGGHDQSKCRQPEALDCSANH